MGLIRFSSPVVSLRTSSAKASRFAGNLGHLRLILPEQVTNFTSEGDKCSFDIPGMTSIRLVLKEHKESESVSIVSEAGTMPELSLVFRFTPVEEHHAQAIIELEAELSPFIQMLASTPLQNLVNIMAEKLAKQF